MRSIYDMGERRELAGEGFLIEPVADCEFRVGVLSPRDVVLETNAPGELSNWAGGYHLVKLENGRWRLYYTAGTMLIPGQTTHRHDFFAAETTDGIHFERCKIPGSKVGDNCVVCHEDTDPLKLFSSSCFVFRDEKPGIPEDERFKMILLGAVDDFSRDQLYLVTSPDGLHFDFSKRKRLALEGDFDSLNTCFYDPSIDHYRFYFRTRNFGVRTIRTAVTEDFQLFESQADLFYGDGEEMAFYTNSIQPYFRAPHIMTGFPMRYSDNGQVWNESVLAHPNLEARANWALKSNCVRLGLATTDGVLILGRDGYHFKRYGEAILRPGPCTEGAWDYGDNDIAPGMIQTPSSIGYGAPDEISVYASENSTTFKGYSRLRRYTMRIDGMASLHFNWKRGEAISRAFTFTGNALSINIATSGAGSMDFELIDALTNQPIPGYSLEDCYSVSGDTLNAIVHWTGGANLSAFAGRPVKLRVAGRDSDLYSLKFEQLEEFPVLPPLPKDLPIQPVFRYVK